MKKLLSIFIAAGLILSGCANGQKTKTDNEASDENEVKTEQMTVKPETAKSSVKSFDVTAKKWEFNPHTIGVRLGDTVRLIVKSEDVSHGFSIPDFKVNQTINAGETATIEFVADKKGSFTFSCSVYCGTGHGNMKGTLIVQ